MAGRARKGGLGRGLASLIPDSTFDDEDDSGVPKASLRQVPLDEIRPNPEQPRSHFDPQALEALAESIQQHGVMTPLVVRRDEGVYILIAGERRLRAAGRAGLQEVPCVVRRAPTALEQLELALVENLQRDDLDPIEAARGYHRLIHDFGRTQQQIAERVGRNRATIANAVRLLALPDDILDRVQRGELSAGHARALLPLIDQPREITGLVNRIVQQRWSVRRTEREVARRVRPPGPEPERDTSFDYATRLLRDALRTSVTIKPRKNGSGRIVLDYADAEELERLIGELRAHGGR